MATLERIVSFWSKSGVGKKGFWVSEHRWRPERGSARGVGDQGADWGRGGGYLATQPAGYPAGASPGAGGGDPADFSKNRIQKKLNLDLGPSTASADAMDSNKL